jgi:hypothetical protein
MVIILHKRYPMKLHNGWKSKNIGPILLGVQESSPHFGNEGLHKIYWKDKEPTELGHNFLVKCKIYDNTSYCIQEDENYDQCWVVLKNEMKNSLGF